MNSKAQTTQFNIFTFMITALIIVLFFGGLIYVMGILNDVFHDVGVANDAVSHKTYTVPCLDNSSATCTISTYVNMTEAGDNIFGQLYDSILALRIVAIMYILGMAVIIIVTNALIKVHPIWFFAYILLSLFAVIFAPQISNTYEILLASDIYDGGLNSFTTANWIILNLPIVVMFISIFGGIFLFINIIRTGGEGNLQ